MSDTKTYEFVNMHGQKIHLPRDMTMEQMLVIGYTDFRFFKPDAELAPGEWRCENKNKKSK